MSELRIKLIGDLLQSYSAKYSDAALTFSNLDGKAQNTITIGGIFLAGSLSFFTGDSLPKLIAQGSRPALVMLGLVVLLLIMSVACCLYAMWIRDILTSDVSVTSDEVKLILDEPSANLPERYERYLLAQVKQLSRISSDLEQINRKKASGVRAGQMLLSVAILSAAILLFYLIITAWRVRPTL
jgi:uncharacterized membrane protein